MSDITESQDKLLVPRTRHRSSVVNVYGTSWYGTGTSPTPTTDRTAVLTETQVTKDRKNLFPFVQYMERKGTTYAAAVSGLKMLDLGWSFYSERLSRSSTLSNVRNSYYAKTLNQSWGVDHSGPVFLGYSVSPLQPWSIDRIEDEQGIAFGLGGTAIARARPNKPIIDLATTIGELRSEGLPKIFGSIITRSKNLRDLAANSGKEYLNAQFGWAPLVRDVVSLATHVLDTRKMLEQYHRDLTREIRRRYSFPEQLSTTSSVETITSDSRWWVQAGTPLGSAASRYFTFDTASGNISGYKVTKTRVNSWFSGAFRYFNATAEHDFGTLSEFEEQANVLLGTRLDPEVLWNLQPWTWLVDWFVNYGDILGNFSSVISDHQVMHYGYIMRTFHDETEYSVPGLWRVDGNFGTSRKRVAGAFHNTVTSTRKLRGAAYPFGFGLDPDTFNVSQWAILGALGISKVR